MSRLHNARRRLRAILGPCSSRCSSWAGVLDAGRRVGAAGRPLRRPRAPGLLVAAITGCPRPREAAGRPVSAPASPEVETDERLRVILPRLRTLFRYTDYTTLDRQRAEVPLGTQQRFTLPGPRQLEVTPDQLQGNSVRMRVRLLRDDQPELRTVIVGRSRRPRGAGRAPRTATECSSSSSGPTPTRTGEAHERGALLPRAGPHRAGPPEVPRQAQGRGQALRSRPPQAPPRPGRGVPGGFPLRPQPGGGHARRRRGHRGGHGGRAPRLRHGQRLHGEGGVLGREDGAEDRPHPGARGAPAAPAPVPRGRRRRAHLGADQDLPRALSRRPHLLQRGAAVRAWCPRSASSSGRRRRAPRICPRSPTSSSWWTARRVCTSARPRMVEMAIGEKTTLEELGGARMHCTVSGCGDVLAASDEEAIALARRYLAFMPGSYRDAARTGRRRRRPGRAAPSRRSSPSTSASGSTCTS